jgi:hypothetical protein
MTTIRQALVWLHATQTFLRLPVAPSGRPYRPAYFTKRDWLGALAWENRRVSIRLSRCSACIGCGNNLPADSTGDHIVPISRGGPQGAQNYLPLCRSCNSRKGSRDLFDWWHRQKRGVYELPADVIVAYARLTFCWYRDRGQLDNEAPPFLAESAMHYLDSLPSSAHRAAVVALPLPQQRQGGLW